MSALTWLLAAAALLLSVCCSAQTETVTGTIYCNNYFKLYANGREIADDPIDSAPHNAVNVTFEVPEDEDVTIAIEAWESRTWRTTTLVWNLAIVASEAGACVLCSVMAW